MRTRQLARALVVLCLPALSGACGGDDDDDGNDAPGADATPGGVDAAPVDAPTDAGREGGADAASGGVTQTPPIEAVALEAWLAEGHYQTWSCEPEAHPARPPGAHGDNRICSNDALAGAPAGPFPAGAASVKELVSGAAIQGYAVAVKLQADSANGAGWYWYERLGTTIYADGTGATACTSCHVAASSTFAPTARDYVFTVVP